MHTKVSGKERERLLPIAALLLPSREAEGNETEEEIQIRRATGSRRLQIEVGSNRTMRR